MMRDAATEDAAAKWGTITMEPGGPVVVGSYGTWTFTYTAGYYGFDSNGTLKIAMRMNSDWGSWQSSDPKAPDYVTAKTSARARLSLRCETRRHPMPWFLTAVVDTHDGYLEPGDTITVTIGDTSGGSPGTRAQTFLEDPFEFATFIDPVGTAVFLEMTRLRLDLVSAPAERLVVTVPSRLAVGEPGDLHVRVIDRYGNPCHDYRGILAFSGEDATLPQPYAFTTEDRGVHRFPGGAIFAREGVHRVSAADGIHAGISNPADVTSTLPTHRLLWGDIHGQTGGTVGTGTIESFFAYARDAANIDVAAHCSNDWITTNEVHAELQRQVRRFDEPGRFVTLLAYEWSGATSAGGDNNVYFLRDDQPLHRASHWAVADKSDEATDRYPIGELYREFAGRDDVMIIPHVGGRKGNLDHHDPDLVPAVELCSVHGRFPWFAEEALDRGLRVAFIASSDDHSGRPGATYPTTIMLGHRGGLVGIYARERTRESVWEAFKAKRLFGTTGERIAVWLEADGHAMGSVFQMAGSPTIRGRVLATAPIERLVLLRGKEVVYTHPLPDQASLDPRRVRVEWSGARIKTRFRSTDWTGGLTLDRGRIVRAEPFSFDSPKDGITKTDERRVEWVSHTNGDPDGVVLELDDAEDARLTFATTPASFTCCLRDLDRGPIVVEAGGVEQRVTIERLPLESGPTEVEFEYVDRSPVPGTNAYWIRLRQMDGEEAWSSPVYGLR